MEGIIKAEWEPLRKVFIHRPGIEMFFGLLDPISSLYERAFSREGAIKEHEMMENVLRKELGVEVCLLKDTVLQAAEERPEIRKKLVAMARETIAFGEDDKYADHARKEFDHYAKYLDSEHFFDILLLNPGIEYHLSEGFRNIRLNILGKQPLCNLYFMRDQQFVTDKGIVITRMASSVRRNECRVTKFLWEEVLGIPVYYEMKAPATIEGGEFIPMGDFALLGIGSRTNNSSVEQLLKLDFGFKEWGIVHQPMHPLVPSHVPDPMINMHLDTYFNVPSSNVVIGNEILLKNASVDVYHNEGHGKFHKEKEPITLYDYIKKKGFHLIPITTLEQMSYASNFLCINDGKLLAIEVEQIVLDVLANLKMKASKDHKRYSKLFEQAKEDFENLKAKGQFFPHKKELYEHNINTYPIILKNLTGGYGGAHCMTCSLTRG